MTFQLLRGSASGQHVLRWPRLGVSEFLTAGSIYFSNSLLTFFWFVCFLLHCEVIKLCRRNVAQGGNAFSLAPCIAPELREAFTLWQLAGVMGFFLGSPLQKQSKEKTWKNKRWAGHLWP